MADNQHRWYSGWTNIYLAKRGLRDNNKAQSQGDEDSNTSSNHFHSDLISVKPSQPISQANGDSEDLNVGDVSLDSDLLGYLSSDEDDHQSQLLKQSQRDQQSSASSKDDIEIPNETYLPSFYKSSDQRGSNHQYGQSPSFGLMIANIVDQRIVLKRGPVGHRYFQVAYSPWNLANNNNPKDTLRDTEGNLIHDDRSTYEKATQDLIPLMLIDASIDPMKKLYVLKYTLEESVSFEYIDNAF